MAGGWGQGRSVLELGLTCPQAQEVGVHPGGKGARGALHRATGIEADCFHKLVVVWRMPCREDGRETS